jgi:hypothetical protein
MQNFGTLTGVAQSPGFASLGMQTATEQAPSMLDTLQMLAGEAQKALHRLSDTVEAAANKLGCGMPGAAGATTGPVPVQPPLQELRASLAAVIERVNALNDRARGVFGEIVHV